MAKTYLGDGVYAEVVSHSRELILTTENGFTITNTIYLDVQILTDLLLWLRSLGVKI